MLVVAYIGFGNSVCRYHLPYVEKEERIRSRSNISIEEWKTV